MTVKSCKRHNLSWETDATYAEGPHGEECPLCLAERARSEWIDKIASRIFGERLNKLANGNEIVLAVMREMLEPPAAIVGAGASVSYAAKPTAEGSPKICIGSAGAHQVWTTMLKTAMGEAA